MGIKVFKVIMELPFVLWRLICSCWPGNDVMNFVRSHNIIVGLQIFVIDERNVTINVIERFHQAAFKTV